MNKPYTDSAEINSFIDECLKGNLIPLVHADIKAMLNCGKPSFTRPAVPKAVILLIEADNLDEVQRLGFSIVKELPDDCNIVWGAVNAPVAKVRALYVS